MVYVTLTLVTCRRGGRWSLQDGGVLQDLVGKRAALEVVQ